YEATGDRDRAERDRKIAQVIRGERTTTVAGRVDPDRVTPPPAPRTGVVRLVNNYNQPEVIRVNGVGYAVDPGQSVDVTVPAGTFTYEVVNIKDRVSRVVEPGQIFTIRVHP